MALENILKEAVKAAVGATIAEEVQGIVAEGTSNAPAQAARTLIRPVTPATFCQREKGFAPTQGCAAHSL